MKEWCKLIIGVILPTILLFSITHILLEHLSTDVVLYTGVITFTITSLFSGALLFNLREKRDD